MEEKVVLDSQLNVSDSSLKVSTRYRTSISGSLENIHYIQNCDYEPPARNWGQDISSD